MWIQQNINIKIHNCHIISKLQNSNTYKTYNFKNRYANHIHIVSVFTCVIYSNIINI